MNKIIKATAEACFRTLGYYPARINGLKFKVDPYHVGYWRSVERKDWEPYTYGILSKLLKPDFVYFDVGAWIGPTVIYAAKLCQHVVCFEPDPIAYRYLRWNIELNQLSNVQSFNLALSNKTSIQRIASFGDSLGDSMTSLLNDRIDGNKAENAADVLAFNWRDFNKLLLLERMDFLKVDIEGGEFDLLPSIKDYLSSQKPIVYLSVHAPFLDENIRKERMRQLIDVMGIYKKCFSENMEQVSIQELISDDTLNAFRAFIFID